MSIKRATDFAIQFIKDNPQFKEEVSDLYELMKDEIEEGNSVENEINLFISSCEDLLN